MPNAHEDTVFQNSVLFWSWNSYLIDHINWVLPQQVSDTHHDLLHKWSVLVYKQYTKLIPTHETMLTKQKYTSLLCIYGL